MPNETPDRPRSVRLERTLLSSYREAVDRNEITIRQMYGLVMIAQTFLFSGLVFLYLSVILDGADGFVEALVLTGALSVAFFAAGAWMWR
ncbi:hypothetical protein [Halomarina pelagica]|uniref:hypothetical protein n=1 Tax=Halomarina pelagica TaxID=2961599 RepID=UPI0020C25028|nr:hypothetical protein [Halomarina sp. BND7]